MDVAPGPEGNLSTGEVQEGKGSGLLLRTTQADSPEWPFRLRHPHKIEMLEAIVLDVLC